MAHKPHRLLLFILLFIPPLLAACAGGGDAPAQTVELYYQALVEKDQDRLIGLSCADYEPMALLEFDSFLSVETTLEDVSCQTATQEDDTARVTCQGAIAASYEGEIRAFSLSSQTYLVTQEAGEWRVCGIE
jgi:hypothetical protein